MKKLTFLLLICPLFSIGQIGWLVAGGPSVQGKNPAVDIMFGLKIADRVHIGPDMIVVVDAADKCYIGGMVGVDVLRWNDYKDRMYHITPVFGLYYGKNNSVYDGKEGGNVHLTYKAQVNLNRNAYSLILRWLNNQFGAGVVYTFALYGKRQKDKLNNIL